MRRIKNMKPPIKILHINTDHKVVYMIVRDGALIRSTIPTSTAVDMLENEFFDLILSEPQSMAVITARSAEGELNPVLATIPRILSDEGPYRLYSTYHLDSKQLKPCLLN
jgi:hypothetical protein